LARAGHRAARGPEAERAFEPRDTGPALPEEADFSALDAEVRRELRGLSKAVAEIVGKHLVAAGLLVDEEPERALEHARYARSRASRVAIVREAAGLTAYHAGEWAEALSELRAARRMAGGNAHLAVMADCERALGRPERALELAAEAGSDVPAGAAVELRIVSAGARRDMGQLDAAVVGLQGPDLDAQRRDPWSARLFYAYADNLAATGRVEDAIRWFLNAAEADDDELTDAAERAVELGATLDPNYSPPVTTEVVESDQMVESDQAPEPGQAAESDQAVESDHPAEPSQVVEPGRVVEPGAASGVDRTAGDE
jgi:tetratricopeptide (TPR) repeat protein